jgi:outer membrane protein OmpA-like peptidoglycan-associated protein
MSPARKLALVALSIALPALSAGPAAADCASLSAEINAALAARQVDRLDTLYASLQSEIGCNPEYRAQAGRLMARLALTTVATDAGPDEIADAARYGRPWQVLVALGDAYYDRRDWPQAVAIYQEALDDMRDTTANPTAPPEEVERRVFKRAVQARALNPDFIPSRQMRGVQTGLADPHFRTFTATAVPVPVQFDYDSAALTPAGRTAVENIFAYLKDSSPDKVVILGHTDPRGSEAYNVNLSGARAESVAAYLRKLGYSGTIEIAPKGETERFVPDDPSKYSEEEQFAFDRRVEYQIAN